MGTPKLHETPPVTQLALAIAHIGGQVVTAKKLHLTQQCISRWVSRGYAPTEHVRALCYLSHFPALELCDPEIKKIIDLITPERI